MSDNRSGYRNGQLIYPISIVDHKKTTEVPEPETMEVEDITAMTDQQLDVLEAGDVVVKVTGTQKHAYTVSYKDSISGGICLTYTDCENVETVSYDHTDSGWVYNSTDNTHIGS